jgi:predicted small lipoprotein YifL
MSAVHQILVSARARRALLAAGTLVLAAGCGQKGPLYLPTGEAAAGRATLPETLTPGSTTRAVVPSTAASAVPPSGVANPTRQP